MKRKIDGMLLATLLTTLFYSATYPYIHKEIVSTVSDSVIALNQIINCLSVIVYGRMWNKHSDRLFKFYPVFCVGETILSIGSVAWAILTENILAYYVIDTLIFAIITRNICCGGVKLKAIRYKTETEREHFDNNNNSMSAVATIIGSLIAMVLDLDFGVMLILATVGNTIDNIFYCYIYFSTMMITKKTAEASDKLDMQRIIANIRCDKCPYCGEDKEATYYLRRGITRKMVKSWTEGGFFSRTKYMRCTVYKCHTCGAEWKTEPNEVVLDKEF